MSSGRAIRAASWNERVPLSRLQVAIASDYVYRMEKSVMKMDLDLKAGFLQSLKREILASLNAEERAIIEVSTGEMGNKPDAVKLGWLKLRTKETWTKQRYTTALNRTIKKLREAVAKETGRNQGGSEGQ
jgi:hypothetical protein